MSTADITTKRDPGNVWLDVLVDGHRWSTPGQAKTTISVHLASAGGVNFFGDPARAFAPRAQEQAAFELALEQFESIINVDFVAAADVNDADIFLAHVNGRDGGGSLGFAYIPGSTTNAATGEDQTGIAINRDAYSSTDLSSLAKGGYDFVTYIHELGHAMGLLHPHDAPDKFPGVDDPFDDFGANEMNQGVFTMMSYNDGWPAGPNGPQSQDRTPNAGWEATPMALDIAALQYLYGANLAFHNGNDIYDLPASNQAGAFYSCIWDAGGRDTLRNASGLDATIDLRAATLLKAEGGGGYLSAVAGINGGFTIANRVIIENAVGGAGADRIMGNAAVNALVGGAGNDTLAGNAGNDMLNGGQGNDDLDGGAGIDRLQGGAGLDALTGDSGNDLFYFTTVAEGGGAADIIEDFGNGQDRIHLALIDAALANRARNDAFTFIGEAAFTGVAGQLRFNEKKSQDYTLVLGDIDGDRIGDLRLKLVGLHDLTAADFIL